MLGDQALTGPYFAVLLVRSRTILLTQHRHPNIAPPQHAPESDHDSAVPGFNTTQDNIKAEVGPP